MLCIARSLVNFSPSGMYKNGTYQTVYNVYNDIPNWLIDSPAYGGSLSGTTGLIVASTKAGSQINATVGYFGNTFGGVQIQILVNGVQKGTQPSTGAASNTTTLNLVTATATVDLVAGDIIKCQIKALSSFSPLPTVQPGATTTFIHVT